MPIKKIAVLTSGGDAPGMNACIRAVCLAAQNQNIEVLGFEHGFNGLLEDECIPLSRQLVHNLIQRGGTILHSARCEKFHQSEQVKLAARVLENHDLDGLIVIGGNGSFKGALALQAQWSRPVVGIPGTIDNDVAGTDYTVGYHTAIQTAVESLDKVRDTADAFERLFVVDVMGREAGFIALNSAIAAGADHVILPETFVSPENELEKLFKKLEQQRSKKANYSYIIVITEHLWPGGVNRLADLLQTKTGIDTRVLTLGHVQRGGSPDWHDRVLATKLGNYAVQLIIEDKKGMMAGIKYRYPAAIPMDASKVERKELNDYSLDIQEKINAINDE